MRKRGITLLEMMIVTLCMVVILSSVIMFAVTALKHTTAVKETRATFNTNSALEDRIRNLLEGAYLSSVATDTSSYFKGGPDVALTNPNDSSDPTLLVFTALSPRVPSELLASNSDFETLNQSYGPQGGMTEYALSLTAIGDSTVDQGLFLRHQTPADGDSSQGGYQSVLDANVDSISYEFYDGTDWIQTWDTGSMTTPRLPAAVRITYHRKDEQNDHQLVVHLLHSDVTPDNPVVSGVQQ